MPPLSFLYSGTLYCWDLTMPSSIPFHCLFFLLWKSHGWFYPSYSTYSSAWATFSVLNEPTMLCELRICVTSGYMQICFEELDETFCLCWDNSNFKLYLISTNPRCPLSHCKVSAFSKWISFGFDWKTPPEPAAIHDPNLKLALIKICNSIWEGDICRNIPYLVLPQNNDNL